MNYIYIDTLTGDYGVMHSRESVSISTGRLIKKNTLSNYFRKIGKNKKEDIEEPKKKVYITDRFIVLPIETFDNIFTNLLVKNISCVKEGKNTLKAISDGK